MPFVGNIGPLELLIVLGIVLLIFGPKRLPGAGKALGQGIREFKDSIGRKSGDDEDRPELPDGSSQRQGEPEPAGVARGGEEGSRASAGAEQPAPASAGAEPGSASRDR